MRQMHISQFDIEHAVLTRMDEISVELAQLNAAGVATPITAQDLFNLEALGLLYDFDTGMVRSESGAALPHAVQAEALVVA